jgi:hypothetical protein
LFMGTRYTTRRWGRRGYSIMHHYPFGRLLMVTWRITTQQQIYLCACYLQINMYYIFAGTDFKVIYQGETFIQYWLMYVAATRHGLKSSSHHASPLIHCKLIVSKKYLFWKITTYRSHLTLMTSQAVPRGQCCIVKCHRVKSSFVSSVFRSTECSTSVLCSGVTPYGRKTVSMGKFHNIFILHRGKSAKPFKP